MGSKKQTQNTKTVTTPTNPQYVEDALKGITGQVSDLSKIDPNSLIANLSNRESDAFARADKLGIDNAWFEKTLNSSAPTVSAASLLDGLESYYSPYRQQVVDSAMADYDYGADATRSAQKLELAGAGGANAFYGSGSGLTRSATEGEILRGRGSLSANLNDSMFKTAAGLSSDDANRRQQAESTNAQLGLQHTGMMGDLLFGRDANERANIATQATAGATERSIEQARAEAGLKLLQTQSGLLSGLPLNLVHGQTQDSTSTTKQSGGLLQQLGTLAMGLGSIGLAPFTGGASLFAGLGGLGAAGTALSAASALGGLAGDRGWISEPRLG